MSSIARPELPHGYLGPQGKFSEWGLSTLSHASPEVRSDSNVVEIKLHTNKPMKVRNDMIGGRERVNAESEEECFKYMIIKVLMS